MVLAAIRTMFAQPDAARVHEEFDVIATMIGRQLPKVETMMRDAREDLLAFTGFPQSHWRKIWSTNPLGRVNREIKGRTDVVGVFPKPPALLRLAGAVLVETHEIAGCSTGATHWKSMTLLDASPGRGETQTMTA